MSDITIVIIVLVFLVVALIVFSLYAKKKDMKQIKLLKKAIENTGILCINKGENLEQYGKKILQELQEITASSNSEFQTKESIQKAQEEAKYSLMLKAKSLGANALIDFGKKSDNFISCSAMNVEQITVSAKAVIVEDIH